MKQEAENRPPEAYFRPPKDRKTPRKVKINYPLQFLHRVMRFDHLHYGLWEDSDPRTAEGLKQAQERYAQLLLNWIPSPVKSILDVGAGTGATGRKLLDRGFEVEGLSPDPYQKELFEARSGRPFHLGRFQEFMPSHSYDLVLMSESAQYVWLDELFPAVRRAAAGGWLLAADYFLIATDGRPTMVKSGHPLQDFLDAATQAGLVLERHEDITDRTAPTLELGRLWLDRYITPTVDLVGDLAMQRYPRLARLTAPLLRKQMQKLDEAEELFDAGEFRRLKRYQILLFRIGG